jgi:ATP synthase protein I
MNPDPKKQFFTTYSRYSGMGLQMLVIIFLGVFGGYELDRWLKVKPLFTIIFSIVSVSLAIYSITRGLLKKKDHDK